MPHAGQQWYATSVYRILEADETLKNFDRDLDHWATSETATCRDFHKSL